MRILKRLLKILVISVTLFSTFFIGFLTYIIINDYKPEDIEDTEVLNDNDVDINGTTFTVTTFNIGYCGLDKDQDFFMDGGTMSHSSSKEQTEENLDAVISFIETNDSDFYFLQEVDVKGSRSFDLNQRDLITEYFSDFTSIFSYNLKTAWIPIPVFDPIGSAYSGLLNLSKFSPSESYRYALPNFEPFPKKYFDLDRSIMEDVYELDNGKKLYMINVHLSAYDKGGEIRKAQVEFIIDYIDDVYNEGENYVVFGGDWNHLLDDTKESDNLPEWIALLPDNLFETGFLLGFDGDVSTVRSNETVYIKGESFETVIDGFLVSPNIRIDSVVGNDLMFENSDHNPVTMTFTLLDDE